jgi:hypothetical protein
MSKTLPTESAQIEPRPGTETAPKEINERPAANAGRKRDADDSRQVETQKLSARDSRIIQRRFELMRLVLEALRKCPILDCAAIKAGVHPKTLANWIKCSKAGHDGYDPEWQDIQLGFHEHCEAAIEEAHDLLHFCIWQMAMGITFRTDPALVGLGLRGPDAYAIDEKGDYIEEGIRHPNRKMIQTYLEWKRPEKYAKKPKRDIFQTGGVLFVDFWRTRRHKNTYAASAKARSWKALAGRI